MKNQKLVPDVSYCYDKDSGVYTFTIKIHRNDMLETFLPGVVETLAEHLKSGDLSKDYKFLGTVKA